jgi:hypothetical protein
MTLTASIFARFGKVRSTMASQGRQWPIELEAAWQGQNRAQIAAFYNPGGEIYYTMDE